MTRLRTIAIATPIIAFLAVMGCGASKNGGSKAWPLCEYTVLELDRASLDDPQRNTVGWPGFLRWQIDGLEGGAEADLTWYGYTSSDIVIASPDSGTTIIRIEGRLIDGPIRYEQTPLNSIELECVPVPGFAYLPIEFHVTTDDGALDETWLGEGRALPLWTPEADEAPPGGTLNFRALEFPPSDFGGSLTLELAPRALDGWDDASWGFGGMFAFEFDLEGPAYLEGGMGLQLHRSEGAGEGVIQLATIAQWAPRLGDDESGGSESGGE
jgi:hypothetical protein